MKNITSVSVTESVSILSGEVQSSLLILAKESRLEIHVDACF